MGVAVLYNLPTSLVYPGVIHTSTQGSRQWCYDEGDRNIFMRNETIELTNDLFVVVCHLIHYSMYRVGLN